MRAAAAAALLCAALAAWAAPADPAATEGLRLAALAERVAKLHAQLAHGVLPARSRRALGEALRDFEAGLRGAGNGATAEARDNHTLLAILWDEYRGWAARPATRENVRKLADRADEVAWVAARPARDARGDASAALLAARACVLSQRVPRLHMQRRLEVRNEELERELGAASAELASLLRKLATWPGNTPEVAAEVQLAETQHGFLARAAREMQRTGAAMPHLENIAKTGDHILESMGRAARLYEAAAL